MSADDDRLFAEQAAKSTPNLLMQLIADSNEKLEQLAESGRQTRRLVEEALEMTKGLSEEFRGAFPSGDPEAHREYHEALIGEARQRKEFWNKLVFELTKWGLIGFLGWLVIQVWTGALKGPH